MVFTREALQEVLRTLEIVELPENKQAGKDFPESMYDDLLYIAQTDQFESPQHLVDHLRFSFSNISYQFIVPKVPNNEKGTSHQIVLLDYPQQAYDVKLDNLRKEMTGVRMLAEQLLYMAHKTCMDNQQWITLPRNYKGSIAYTGQIYELRVEKVYSLKIWNYNESLNDAHRPPRMRAEQSLFTPHYYQ